MKKYSHLTSRTEIQNRFDRAMPVFKVQYGNVYYEKRFWWDLFDWFAIETVEWDKKIVYFDIDGNVIE